MKKAFLHYLNSIGSSDFQPINDFIITELKEYTLPIIIKNLQFLEDLKLISMDKEMHHDVKSWVKNGTTISHSNIFNDHIWKVKITEKGRDMINEIDLSKKSSIRIRKSWKSIFKYN